MTIPTTSKTKTCQLFGCTMDQLNAQYLKNAQDLRKMAAKAEKTFKKVNGYTAAQLLERAEAFEKTASEVIESVDGYELRTTPNGECFTTLIYKGEDFIAGTFSTPLDKLSSVDKAKYRIETGKQWIPENYKP